MEIRCPHCDSVFDLSEDLANHIRNQVRNDEFEKELNEKLKSVEDKAESDKKAQVSDAILKEREKYEKKLQEASDETLKLKEEISKLKSDKQSVEDKALLEVKNAKLEAKEEYSKQIADLKSDKEAIERERDYYKDLKSKMSTKMVGETLEQHCEIEFNKIRMAAFPRAEFGKDNIVSKETGSKGDYIFREYDEDGIEIISIMFEMKNEMETTVTKKTNEHFFKELDKDRKEKKCEYAVLVSLLEADNELYNQGIVDVSYQYDKMYVIRPQFFIPIITLLRNAALNSHDSRRELVKVQNQNIDVANFKENFEAFKKGFSYNYTQAGKRLNEAVDDIDKAIARLEAVKVALTASNKQLSLADRKAEDVTIEKLCKDSPMMLEQFRQLDDE